VAIPVRLIHAFVCGCFAWTHHVLPFVHTFASETGALPTFVFDVSAPPHDQGCDCEAERVRHRPRHQERVPSGENTDGHDSRVERNESWGDNQHSGQSQGVE
jgi:hypothetical protein